MLLALRRFDRHKTRERLRNLHAREVQLDAFGRYFFEFDRQRKREI